MGQEGAVFTDQQMIYKYIFSAAARVANSSLRSFMAELPDRIQAWSSDSYLYHVAASIEDGRAIALQYGPYEPGMTLDDPRRTGKSNFLCV